MRTYNPRLTLSLCALATGLLITACGGGTATPPGTTPLTSGFAIDGYLSGSTILCDINDNGAADSGENTTTTDSTGFYKFATECKAPVVATGGKSTDTLLDFTGKLKSPAGATVITPLTTLVASGMTMAQVNTALGLPASTDLLNTDAAAKKDGAYVNGDLFKKTLAVQQLLQQTTDVFANLGGGTSVTPALYSEVAKAMAAELKKGTALNSGTTVNDTVVSNIVKAAHAQVSNSALFTSTLKTQVAAVTADNLAQVTAASLKDQAEGLLKSTDTALVDKAKTSQTDTKIKDFVATNKTALATGASPSSIATLASNLTDQVKGTNSGGGSSGGSSGGSTPESGDSLVSFDESQLTWVPFDGTQDRSAIVSDAPTGATGKALKIIRDGDKVWAGAYVSLTTAIPFTSDRKTISARVYSSKAGIPMKLKIEKVGDSGGNIEVAANETVVSNAWQTLTWTFSAASTSSNVQYKTITLLPDLGTLGSGDIYYFDNIRLAAAAASGGGSSGGGSSGGSVTTLNFSTGFASTTATVEGGKVSRNGGSNLDGWECSGSPAWCGNGSGGSGANSYFYSYYQTPSVPTGMYSGVDIYAPSITSLSTTGPTGGIQITNQTKINFTFNPNPEWYSSGTKNFAVDLTLGKLFGSDCHQQLRAIVTPTSASATAYSVNLSDFIVAQDCGVANTTVTSALTNSPITIVAFKGAGGVAKLSAGGKDSGGNISVANLDGVYPTTVALTGGITFN